MAPGVADLMAEELGRDAAWEAQQVAELGERRRAIERGLKKLETRGALWGGLLGAFQAAAAF